MPLYRTPTSEIHPQEWRLHLRRLASGHRALPPSSRRRLSVRLASSPVSLDNLGCIVLIFTGCLGADGGGKTESNMKYNEIHILARLKKRKGGEIQYLLTTIFPMKLMFFYVRQKGRCFTKPLNDIPNSTCVRVSVRWCWVVHFWTLVKFTQYIFCPIRPPSPPPH